MLRFGSVVFSFAFLLLVSAQLSFAQPDGYVEVASRHLLAGRDLGCVQLKEGVYDRSTLAVVQKIDNCQKDVPIGSVDPDAETLIRYSVGSDCHMRVTVKVFRVDAEKKYKVIINNIYGGCRAGGWRSGWVAFEKLPPGYNVEIKELKIDRIHGPQSDANFGFPLPPSVVKKENISVSEVDLKGCLPLTGQSQWVLQSATHLETAISGSAEPARCRKVFDELNIDLAAFTLIGYSFSSGHCSRPVNLIFDAVKETSSYARENRYLITARFDDPGSEYCKTWTTHGVWLVVPKLPSGYGIDLEAKANNP